MKEVAQTVFSTDWFNVEMVSYPEIESTKNEPYYRINSPDGIIVLATTDSGSLILVRQFRPALGAYTLEFPSGAIDPGENPEQAARREFSEETGDTCGKMESLGAGHIMLNRHRCLLHAFFAQGAVRDPVMSCEPLETLVVTASEFKEFVLKGMFDQYAALGLLPRIEWQLGIKLVG